MRMTRLTILPCLDSEELAERRRAELDVPRSFAADLGRSAMQACVDGQYRDAHGRTVDWAESVAAARAAKRSIAPDTDLPVPRDAQFPETRVQVTNETTTGAARRLVDRGLRPLALNFANGVKPGGGFLSGARAQEETLCRSSALYQTLVDDPMYEAHRRRPEPDSTAWAILSPDVPVFRTDEGTALSEPWPLSFLTCAAPYAPRVGQPRSADLLEQRIHRILSIARAYRYEPLILGAWGCGAFENDPVRTAADFRDALDDEFAGAFREVVFAITDWSAERRFLAPFRDAFSAASSDPAG